ncbi:MAG: NAD(P)/FAD-dependent oxidoreductase [Dehalococcoidia bacterium]|uniref:dihydrolipoyl dehydrogenase family protein n=1 Tax=Candidatus Amarobacter glycogenicus TaxID=3140699 RepID=UPI0031352261|nr:NAD(P)/FAD-dependent oxidoreductase [Dehalococcoidia bacterium]
METVDVAVIGGGPGGYSAALKAAELGAKVALIEAERPGGACVHHACIPTNILLDSALTHLAARELSVMGVFEVGDQFNFARASARKDTLVRKIAEGVNGALRMRKVQVIEGRASFQDSHTLAVTGRDSVRAGAIIVATGTRWEPPVIPGVEPGRILTADAVQSLSVAPPSATVLCDGPAETAFGLEYATLLALAGTEVTAVTSRPAIFPGLDPTLAEFASNALRDLGIAVFEQASVAADGQETLRVTSADGSERTVAASVVVAADPRRPFFETLDLARAGVTTGDTIPVDRDCRTNVAHIFAVGDVTGGTMLTNAAIHMGEVAGANATGGHARTRLRDVPHLLHTVPEVGWAGLTEEAARASGFDVATGMADLSFNARAIVTGARQGLIKVVADREIGQVLGVHAAGPGASEVITVAATIMQAEIPLADLAALVTWHPGVTEGLVEAARRALAGR